MNEISSPPILMASLIKQFSGRKRESDVHRHFVYNVDVNKSICQVESDKGKTCGSRIAGKNTTNLRSHLQHHHKAVYEELRSAEELVKATKIRRVDSVSGES